MFLFDWTKIYIASHGNAREIYRIFKMLVEKQVPVNRKDPIYKYSQKNFTGDSFMLHPEVLLHHSYKYKFVEIAQYIALCSYRPTGDYLATREVRLDSILVPATIIQVIQNNRLLYISEDDGYLHFMYEEVNSKEIH